VLRILAEDATIAARIREVAVAYVEDSAPRAFIETSLPLWSATLLRSLSPAESHQ
jgi:hypothetical protein